MEIPDENVKRLFANALKVGRKVTIDSYLKRFPSLSEMMPKPKPEPVKEVPKPKPAKEVPKPKPKGKDLNVKLGEKKEAKEVGKKRK